MPANKGRRCQNLPLNPQQAQKTRHPVLGSGRCPDDNRASYHAKENSLLASGLMISGLTRRNCLSATNGVAQSGFRATISDLIAKGWNSDWSTGDSVLRAATMPGPAEWGTQQKFFFVSI